MFYGVVGQGKNPYNGGATLGISQAPNYDLIRCCRNRLQIP